MSISPSKIGWMGVLLAALACSQAETPGAVVDASTEKTPPPGGDAAPVIVGPEKLSETGLYTDFAARTVTPGVLEFSPKYPLWADGAEKRRFLWLPEGTKIDTSSMDDWTFPVGTKAWKQFTRDGKLVETRLLWKKAEATWFEMAYAWLPDESDAIAVPNGSKNARGTSHDVPDQVKCNACHANTADTLLGLGAIQLSDGGSGFLTVLAKSGRLTAPPAGEFSVPGSPSVSAALGYLHGNCGHCHNDESVRLNTQTKMRLRVLVGQSTPEETGAFTTTVGTVMKHTLANGVTDVVVKGDPERSGLWLRMGLRDFYGMPPAGTQVVDDVGRETIRQWIVGWP